MEKTQGGQLDCIGYAARDESGVLSPFKFSRRAPGPDDVALRVTHCGICHAELLWVFNVVGDVRYPIVPGHEIVGIVTKVGDHVARFKVGDRVGVGTYVGSCRKCEYCNDNMENYCDEMPITTYNGIDEDGSITRGGFSSLMVVHQRYVVGIPKALASDVAAPLLCAGITVYSPMIRHGMNKAGKHLGVIGLGGLGHMAVKFGKAFGLCVTVLSTSSSKKEEALGVIGADSFLLTTDGSAVQAAANSLDFILDTASAKHPLDLYLPLLKKKGVLVLVGAQQSSHSAPPICSWG